jgi:hypothetical protein
MKFGVPKILSILLVVSAASSLLADTETFEMLGSGLQLPNYTEEFTIPQFNPDLGMLDSMTWSIAESQFIVLAPYCQLDSGGGYETVYPYFYDITSGYDFNGTPVQGEAQGSVPVGTVCSDVYPTGFYQQMSGSGVFSNANQYIGNGYVSINTSPAYLSGTITDDGTTGAADEGYNAFFSDFNQEGGQLTIVYTYTPVPEPTYWMMLFGLGVGMIWIRARAARPRKVHQ